MSSLTARHAARELDHDARFAAARGPRHLPHPRHVLRGRGDRLRRHGASKGRQRVGPGVGRKGARRGREGARRGVMAWRRVWMQDAFGYAIAVYNGTIARMTNRVTILSRTTD